MDLPALLESFVKTQGSDLHLVTGKPPLSRVRERLTPLSFPTLDGQQIQNLFFPVLSPHQASTFEKARELDFIYKLSPEKRFRVNLHWERGQVEAAVRLVPARISTPEQLALPPVVSKWIEHEAGLVLICGPAFSGKTTTLHSLTDQINRKRQEVILIIEYCSEVGHTDLQSIVKQREIGTDTLSAAHAIRQALRQDTNVIVIDEIEDHRAAQAAMNAAESGKLVLASFHATYTSQALERFLSLCLPHQRTSFSVQLASCLKGVLTQHLLPREQVMGGGLAMATEIFVPTERGRNYIRGNSLSQLVSVIETEAAYEMHTLGRSIRELVSRGMVATDVAEKYLSTIGIKP